MSIVMDPETGEVLAMAVTPDYNPNNARKGRTKAEREALSKMSDKKQMEYLNKMWRNPLIQDTYEPGSTFKLMTLAMLYEENLVKDGERFYDSGSTKVNGIELKCWSDQAHGRQSIKKALANSCNPVFARLGLRVGMNRFFDYVSMFGYDNITGIDFPGEAQAILQDQNVATSVDLATMAYGQGIAVTPIQLASAVSAIGNDGVMMQPHLVKEIKSSDGSKDTKIKPKIVRQIISKKTSNQLKSAMKYVVNNSAASNSKVPGYTIGGKTGTANKPNKSGYSDQTNSSYIGMAPMEDPKVTVLVIVDNPKGIHYGSIVAGPCAHDIFENILPYLGIEPSGKIKKEQAAAKNEVKVPDVRGMSYSKAKSTLKKAKLKVKVQKGDKKKKSFKVKDQYPNAGSSIEKKSTIYLYGSD